MEGEGKEEQHQHGAKKSVLKKVKDKAKKIKDTIKHGHSDGHDHDHELEGGNRSEDNYQQVYEEEDRDVDDDDDEEEEQEDIANDPQVHGAQMYESTVIRSTTLPRETYTNLEKPTYNKEDRYEHGAKDQGLGRPVAPRSEMERPPTMEAHASEREPEKSHTLPGPDMIDRDKPNVAEPKIKFEPPDQSKVTDPTDARGKEDDVAPLVRQFDNLNVHDARVSKPESEQRPDSGNQDQFTPRPDPAENQTSPESNPVVKPENPEFASKSKDSSNTEGTSQDTITGKISSASSAVANKAVYAKDMVVSKLGYGGDHQERQDSSKKPVSESASEYAHKAAETIAPVYEKVAGAGSAVMSKVQGSSGAENQDGDSIAARGANNVVSVKEYLSEKFRPGDEDKALSEVITNALHKKKEAVPSTGDEQQGRKVTMSEEVRARLGTAAENKREGEDALAAGQESSGHGVVDKLKDAVNSWLGKSNGMQTAEDSVGRSFVSNIDTSSGKVEHGDEGNVERSRATD